MCFIFSGLEWESLIVTRPLVSAYQEQVTKRCSLEMSWLTGLDFGLHHTISKASLCQGSRYATTETWTLHFYPFSTHYHHEVASLDLENSAVILFLINKIFFFKKRSSLSFLLASVSSKWLICHIKRNTPQFVASLSMVSLFQLFLIVNVLTVYGLSMSRLSYSQWYISS